MPSARRSGRGPLARVVARVLIAALVLGLLPAPAHASLPATSRTASPRLDRAADLPLRDQSSSSLVVFVTEEDGEPCALLVVVADPIYPSKYHRARWMDPKVDRFLGMDPLEGEEFEPATLHKYLYAGVNPLNNVDPTGLEFNLSTSLNNLSIQTQLTIQNLVRRVGVSFAEGNPSALGPLWRAIGSAAENAFRQTILYYQRLRPALAYRPDVLLRNGRVFDAVLKFGRQTLWAEAKSSLPRQAGPALTRLVAQLQGVLAEAGAGDQILVWSFRIPTQGQINLLLSQLGAGAARVEFVSGVEGFWLFLVRTFGAVL